MRDFQLSAYALPVDQFPVYDFPPLPRITDPELFQIAITHASVYMGGVRKITLDGVQGEIIEDYEKLEHVGDAILG